MEEWCWAHIQLPHPQPSMAAESQHGTIYTMQFACWSFVKWTFLTTVTRTHLENKQGSHLSITCFISECGHLKIELKTTQAHKVKRVDERCENRVFTRYYFSWKREPE